MAPFPRQTRRGLIEAALTMKVGGCEAVHFPGRHAGASLKHGRPTERVEIAADISPADTPGPH